MGTCFRRRARAQRGRRDRGARAGQTSCRSPRACNEGSRPSTAWSTPGPWTASSSPSTSEQAREVARHPREQLLLRQDGDEVELGLFFAPDALANLGRHDPTDGLHAGNFDDFCLVVEGVSHYLYVVRCAGADRSVSALELELQAEVDKFACCTLLDPRPDRVRTLTRQLYEFVAYHDDLDADERDRYRVANDNAQRFARSLALRFVETGRVEGMLDELRAFYRLDLSGKRAHIARLAA